jgi:hypothetical protein
MKSAFSALPVALLLAACAGDNHTSRQSPQEPARFAHSGEVNTRSPRPSKFSRGRVYLVQRLETADGHRSEWRTLGETIVQNGSTIQFIELGSGRPISFTAPHQVTATNSTSDRVFTQGPSDEPGQGRTEIPEPGSGR